MRAIPSVLRSTLLACVSAGCVAPSALNNYAVDYRFAGAANETSAQNDAAEAAFKNKAVSDDVLRASAAVRVFLDSVPDMLVLQDGVVRVKDGASAVLLGSVELTPTWVIPTGEEALPAFQRAAASAGADIAFCPRREVRLGYKWTCYLVRASAPPVNEPTTRSL